MEQPQVRIFSSAVNSKPNYDFSVLAESIPPGPLHEIFLSQEEGLNSADPEKRWTILDGIKIISRQDTMLGIEAYRTAVSQVVSLIQGTDPNAGVREKAAHTAQVVNRLRFGEISAPDHQL